MASSDQLVFVIGNSAYPMNPIPSAMREADEVASAFRRLGLKVLQRYNLTAKDIRAAFSDFCLFLGFVCKLGAIVYFSGSVYTDRQGISWLAGIDAHEQAEPGVEISNLLEQLAKRAKSVVLIVDSAGIARVDQPGNTFVLLSSQPAGSVKGGGYVTDGQGKSLFATTLVEVLREPGLDVDDIARRVRKAVETASGGQQIPWVSTSVHDELRLGTAGTAVSSRSQSASVEVTPSDVVALRNANCTACHAANKKMIGPSWMDIASRYAGDTQAVMRLAERIRSGGSGAWGSIPKPPNPMREPEAELLARVVLAAPTLLAAFEEDEQRAVRSVQAPASASQPSSSTAKPSASGGGGFGDFMKGMAKVLGAVGMAAGVAARDPGLVQQSGALFSGDANEMARTQAQRAQQEQAARQAAAQSAQQNAASADCAQLLHLANEARRRQVDMGSLGSTMGAQGSNAGAKPTGQAGAQNDMYNVYMGAYRAKGCR